MAVTLQTDQVKGLKPIPYPGAAGTVVACRVEVPIATNHAAATQFELFVLPAGCRIVDFTVDCTEIDTDETPEFAFDLGYMSGTPGDATSSRTVGDELVDGDATLGGGGILRAATAEAVSQDAVAVPTSIGLLVTVDAQTFQAGTLGATFLYAAV